MGAYSNLGTDSGSGGLVPMSPSSYVSLPLSNVAVPANVNRKAIIIVNIGDNTVYFGDGMAAILGAGAALLPGGTLVAEGSSCTVNAIYAISDQPTALSIQEYI